MTTTEHVPGPRCRCGHSAKRHAGISGCLWRNGGHAGLPALQYDDIEATRPLTGWEYQALKMVATCACGCYHPAQTWRVSSRSMDLGMMFDRRPFVYWVIVAPDGVVLGSDLRGGEVAFPNHALAFRVAQALADTDAIAEDRRDAAQSGRHPAGKLRDAVVAAQRAAEGVAKAQRRLMMQHHTRSPGDATPFVVTREVLDHPSPSPVHWWNDPATHTMMVDVKTGRCAAGIGGGVVCGEGPNYPSHTRHPGTDIPITAFPDPRDIADRYRER
jgi:hypothetical protein